MVAMSGGVSLATSPCFDKALHVSKQPGCEQCDLSLQAERLERQLPLPSGCWNALPPGMLTHCAGP